MKDSARPGDGVDADFSLIGPLCVDLGAVLEYSFDLFETFHPAKLSLRMLFGIVLASLLVV